MSHLVHTSSSTELSRTPLDGVDIPSLDGVRFLFALVSFTISPRAL